MEWCSRFCFLVRNQVPDKKIEMRWRFKSWPEGHHSNVTLELEQKPDGTELRLRQTGIPASSFEQTKAGWQNYYWRSIKQTFGYGAFFYWCFTPSHLQWTYTWKSWIHVNDCQTWNTFRLSGICLPIFHLENRQVIVISVCSWQMDVDKYRLLNTEHSNLWSLR